MPTIITSGLRDRLNHYRLVTPIERCYDNLDPSVVYTPHLANLQTYVAPEPTGLDDGRYDVLLVDGELWATWASQEGDNAALGVDNYAIGPWVAKWDDGASDFVLVGDQLETEFHWLDGEWAEMALATPPGLSRWPDYTPCVRRSPTLCTDGTDVFCVYELVMNVMDQLSTMGPTIPNTLYRCRRWTGSTWELYGEINPQNGSDPGVINVDRAFLNTNGADCNTMPPQCVAEGGNVYAVFSEMARDDLSSFSNHRRTRFVHFDGTAPPSPGDGDGYASFTDIDTSNSIVFVHGAVPKDWQPWYAMMLNSTGPVVYYVRYNSIDATTETQVRVWSQAGGALGTIPSTACDSIGLSDLVVGPRLSTETVDVAGTEMYYLALEPATGPAVAYVILVEVESPTSVHHRTAALTLDSTGTTFDPYGVIVDGSNLWVPGVTGVGETFLLFTEDCYLPFWTGAGGLSTISPIARGSHRGELFRQRLWFGDWPALGNAPGSQTYFSLRYFPIHRCLLDCDLLADVISQFFRTSDPPYNPPGPEDWDATAIYGGTFSADTIEFYIDGGLVSTATHPDAFHRFYYGDVAPGTIDLSTLSNGFHTMTVVAYWTPFGVSVTDSATIKVGP